MPEGKIEVSIGEITFVGEGEQNWVAEQLDPALPDAPPELDTSEDAAIAQKTLPAFLGEKNAKSNQTIKFLATAIWLHAKGSRRLKTGDITSAISNANQTRFSNPSNCLAQNVKKGFIEKTGSEFFVTDDGKASLL